MQLHDALRISPDKAVLIALIGAGGKTSAMGRLGRELSSAMNVILTTTTRLGVGQEQIADRHAVVESQADLQQAIKPLRLGEVHLLTGPKTSDGEKWTGLELDLVENLRQFLEKTPTAILVEADGARQRSIKFPAPHEPALPSGSEIVLLIAGLDALGQPIDERFVHRPQDLLSYLSMPAGSRLQIEHMTRLLTDPEGGLRDVPQSATVHTLLNKAETPDRLDQGEGIAEAILATSRIRSVLLTELKDPEPVKRSIQRIGGVVLAAGGSTRLPTPKQLIQWRGKPLIQHVLDAAIKGRLDPVVAVLGSGAVEIQLKLAAGGIETLMNTEWRHGQSTSVRLGLGGVEARVDGVMFLLADMPLVGEDLIRALVAKHRRTLKPLIAPLAGGRRANPVLFDRRTFGDLKALQGDEGGRSLFDRYAAAWVEWDDSVLVDIDTPSDLARLKRIE